VNSDQSHRQKVQVSADLACERELDARFSPSGLSKFDCTFTFSHSSDNSIRMRGMERWELNIVYEVLGSEGKW
jgi:hypothetical protein